MRGCEICGKKTSNRITHHVSYYPEITQEICGGCHNKIIREGRHVKRPENFKRQSKQNQKKPIVIDESGRITIPKRFREALGLPENQKYHIWVEEYRNDRGECKALIIRK